MHQVRVAADLDVALDSGAGERVEQPARVVIEQEPVPFAADDGNGTSDVSGVVGKLTMPGLDDVAERAERRLDAGRISGSALPIAVEGHPAPFLEMSAREHWRLMA